MKRIFILILFIIGLTFNTQAKISVLTVGISEYPENSGWNRLNAANDIDLISSLSDNVIVLENNKATYNEIHKALNILTNKIESGDTVIVHFSGHGQQIVANNSKEIDGLDEALIPFDAFKEESSTYKGQNHFRDDDFGTKIETLRAKTGPSGIVIAVIDACHSDSMDKDADEDSQLKYRGTDEIFGTKGLNTREIQELKDRYFNQEENTILAKEDKLSDVIFISACGTHQRNYEIEIGSNSYGSLSYYFYKSYIEKGFGNLPVFLSYLYDSMTSDKVMKFHGQEPVIRNTIGWQKPNKNPPPPPDPLETPPGDGLTPLAIIGISLGGLLIITLVFYLLWKQKRK